MAARLEPARLAHATGHCSWAIDSVDIEFQNGVWWEDKQMVSVVNDVARRWWPPHGLRLCDCDPDSETCADFCESGTLRHPDINPAPHGAG
jgi:hypothetical protein